MTLYSINCHPELDSGSSTPVVAVCKQRAWKIPYQVRNDTLCYTTVVLDIGPKLGLVFFGRILIILLSDVIGGSYEKRIHALRAVSSSVNHRYFGGVALPQYQKAVAKSRFAALKPIAKAVKDAQEICFEGHGEYAENIEDLDIQVPPEANVNTTFFPSGDLFVFIVDERLENNAYIVVLAHSPNFANNTYCAFDESSAEALCKAEGTFDDDASDSLGIGMYRLSGNSSGSLIPIQPVCPTKCCDSMGNPVIC